MRRFAFAAATGTAIVVAASGIGSAADMPVRAPVYKAPPVVAPVYNWTGFYVGGHVGYGWASDTETQLVGTLFFPAGTAGTINSNGVLGGVQAGFNYQVSNWVFGVEGDFSWTNANGSTTGVSTLFPGVTSTSTAQYDSYATVTGRVGYAWDNWLVYAKGGGAFARVEYGGSSFVPGPGTLVANPISDTLSGWTAGGGLEYGFLNNWSAKAEYNYLDFGTTQRAFTVAGIVGPATNFDTHVHMVKFGLNYRFGGR